VVCKNKATLNEDCSSSFFDRFKKVEIKNDAVIILLYISSATTVTQEGGWLMMFDEYKGG